MRAKQLVLGISGAALLAACSHGAGPSFVPGGFQQPPALRRDAGGFSTIYSFKFLPDGMEPAAGMIAVGSTLYGTTQSGGQGGAGAVFTSSTAGKEHVIYSFGSNGPDGVFPVAGLVSLGGEFYGTTSSGGTSGFGAVYKISKTGSEKLLYSFKGGSDGSGPYAPLVVYKGALYGTTLVGGNKACAQGCGTIFEVTAAGKEHVLYAFKGGSDGIGPVASLVVLGSEFYGTTANGGKDGDGTIFKTNAAGKEQVLYAFKGGDDGGEPEAGLVVLGGTLYGTTNAAGKNFNGVVFSATTSGNENAIYSFKGGSDGANPEANLIVLKGKLYGTTAGGGAAGLGTVFSVTSSGSEHVLHAFKSSEGSDPRAPVVAVNGTLYGTASMGGANGLGSIFKVSP
jgi:uncharacterized repeat protein (TIGR03803 family)